MWETLAQPHRAPWIIVALTIGAAFVALRSTRTRGALAPASLLLGALPGVVAAALCATELAQLTLAPGTNLAAADVASRGPMATMLLSMLHQRLFVGQAVTALGLALVGIVLAVRSRRPAAEGTRRPGSLALVWAACALTCAVAAYTAHERAGLLDALADAPERAYLAALLDAAATREKLHLLRAALAAAAVLLALVVAKVQGTQRERVATGAVLLLGVAALHADAGVMVVATQRVATTFATPWTDDAAFQPIRAADVSTDLSLGYPYTEVAVVLGVEGPRDYTRGVALPSDVAALTEALIELRDRLAQERARVAEAYAAREAQEEEPPLDIEGDSANDMAAPPDAMGRLVARATWTTCTPATDEHTLSVAADRRATADSLRVLVEAATGAGFGSLELVMPATDPAETRALQGRDPAGGALVGHTMRAVQLLLVARCVAGDVPFMTGVVSSAPLRVMRRSDGIDVPVGDPPGLDALPDLPLHFPTVVLALGPDATPVALVQATQDMLERMVSDTPILVSAPELLPATDVPADAPAPEAPVGPQDATAEGSLEPDTE